MKSALFYRILFSLLLLFIISASVMAFLLIDDAQNTAAAFRLQQARTLTRNLAESSLDALAAKDYEQLDRLLQVSVLDDGFAYAYINRSNGLIIADTNPAAVATRTIPLGKLKKPLLRNANYRGRPVREVVYPAYLGNRHVANAHLAYYLDSSIIYSTHITLRLMASLLITLLLLSIATAIILRRALTPIEKLASVMRQTEDYLPVLSPQLLERSDEVGLLARNFSDLMQRLAGSYNQLFKEKEFHQVTLESIADAVIVTDRNGNLLYMNSVAEQLTGWQTEETRGQPLKSIFSIIDASTRLPIDNPVDKVLATGEVIYLSNHTTLIARDKTEYQIADSASPIRDRNGDILGMVLVFNNVTEQYQLRESTARSKRNLQAIMDHSPAVIYAKDPQGHYLFANQTFKQLFQQQDDLPGKTDFDIFPVDFAQKQAQLEQQILTGGDTLEREEQIAINNQLHDFLSVKFPLLDVNNKIYAICCIATDITERKKQEETLRRSQKMEALGQLTGGVAHDYNNMLGIVLGYAELLERQLDDQPVLARYAHQIYHAAQRGGKLTRKLLSFTRQEGGQVALFNLNTLIQEQQQVLEKTLTARIKLNFNLAPQLWAVCIDDSDFEDAILNLCINAMHAMEGNGQLTIHTCNRPFTMADTRQYDMTPGDYVLLTITDTGCGMDEKTREQIFDPFYTTKGKRGSGLGLSQVYGFIQRSGGQIQVFSEPGQGTQFALYFPRSQQTISKAEDDIDGLGKDLHGTESILVVDDEQAIVSLTANILTEYGYRVFSAHNGLQALQLLEKEKVDLIITDLIMPQMDGYQLAAEVKRLYPQIRIQLVSGFADERHNPMADKTLQKHIIDKPYTSQRLLTRVRELLEY